MKRSRPLPEWLQVLHNFTETPYVVQAQVDELKQSLRDSTVPDKATSDPKSKSTPWHLPTPRPAKPQSGSATYSRNTPANASLLKQNAEQPSDRTGQGPQLRTVSQTQGAETDVNPAEDSNRSIYRAARQAGYATSVLDAYPWKATAAELFRGILRVQTADGVYALKRTHISGQRVAFLQQLTRYAADHKFHRMPAFLKTKKGRAYAVRQNEVYYATHWIDGQQANFSALQQVQAAAQALARFHEASRGFEPNGFVPKMEFDIATMLRERRNDLRALVAQCERKKSVDAFDETFLDLKNSLLADANDSLKSAEQSTCVEFLQSDQANPGVCHLDVTPQNIVMDTDGRAVLIDLDLATFAPRALDLGHLLRRSLQQSHWDSQLAYGCFLEYHTVCPLTSAEYQLVLAVLRFPHRAWRLARSHYRDSVDPAQLDELRSYRAQEEQRQAFLHELEAEIGKVRS